MVDLLRNYLQHKWTRLYTSEFCKLKSNIVSVEIVQSSRFIKYADTYLQHPFEEYVTSYVQMSYLTIRNNL